MISPLALELRHVSDPAKPRRTGEAVRHEVEDLSQIVETLRQSLLRYQELRDHLSASNDCLEIIFQKFNINYNKIKYRRKAK